jgi:hypothetical protein
MVTMMANPASIYVQDHGFFVTDRDIDTPFETMDHGTGLAGVMESAALLHAGIDRGYVTVSAQPMDHRPELDTDEQWAGLAAWDDIAEFSLYAPHGALTVEQLEYGPFDARPKLPLLSPHGPGHYRLRIHTSGRDHHYDQVIDQSGERFHIIAWPAPPAATLVIKAVSRCGYGLRLAALESPPRTEPIPPTPEEQAEAEHEAMLRRNLLGR